jgi:hypothetical protein
MRSTASEPSSLSNELREDLRFEYDQLRKEILQNDTHALQIFGGTVLLAGTIITIASSLDITLTLRGIFIFLVWLITAISLHQAIDRGRSSFVIASYLRLFVEDKLEGVKWETRLAHFRSISRRHGYNSILTGQLWTYNLILLVTFVVGSWYFISDLPPTLDLRLVLEAAGLLVWACFTFWLLWSAFKGFPDYGIKNIRFFDAIWIAADERYKAERSDVNRQNKP